MTDVEVLRRAVLESWVLTQQRAVLDERVAEERVGFTRYGVTDEEATTHIGDRRYRMFKQGRRKIEQVAWVPFTELLRQFESAVRAEERRR